MEKNDRISKFLFKKLPEKYRIFPVLFGAVLIHLSLGTYHTFGNMVPYLASYMKNQTNPNIEIDQLLWIPMFQGCFPFAMVIGGFLCSKFGPRCSALIGCSFMTGGVFLSSLTIKYSLILFLLTYGIMFGLGQGIAYVVAVSSVINWAEPKRVGLFSGLVAGAFGISAAIFTPIQTAIINPENFVANSEGYFTEPKLLQRVPNIFLLLSSIYAIMQIIGLIFICDPPKIILSLQKAVLKNQKLMHRSFSDSFIINNSKLICLGNNNRQITSVNKTNDLEAPKRRRVKNPRKVSSAHLKKEDEKILFVIETDVEYYSSSSSPNSSAAENSLLDEPLFDAIKNSNLHPKIVLRSWTFYSLFLTLFCCSFYGNLYYGLYKTYSNIFIDDDIFMAGTFSIGIIANAISRILWGIIADKFSFQFALSMATSLASVLLFTMPLTQFGGKPMYMIWLILMFMCVAANQTLFITAAVKCFGSQYKSINYGCLIFSTTISGILLSTVCQTLLSKIGYTWMFIIGGFFALMALIASSFTRFTQHGRCISIQKRAVKRQMQYFSNNLDYLKRKKNSAAAEQQRPLFKYGINFLNAN